VYAVPQSWSNQDVFNHPAVSVAIPGAKTPAQVEANAAASARPLLSEEDLRLIQEVSPL
jgi:myo-inositol catabolism protein IolS